MTWILCSNSEAANVRNLRWESPLNVSALLMQFCLFYSHEFQWGSEVVSPRLGCRMQIREQCFSWLETWGESRLHIEDPFILERNLNCVLGSWQEGAKGLVGTNFIPNSLSLLGQKHGVRGVLPGARLVLQRSSHVPGATLRGGFWKVPVVHWVVYLFGCSFVQTSNICLACAPAFREESVTLVAVGNPSHTTWVYLKRISFSCLVILSLPFFRLGRTVRCGLVP